MGGLELAVEQREAAEAQPCDQPGQGDLRRIGRAADHAFAEEGATDREAIQSADQPVAVAAFHRMCEAHPVKADEHVLDGAVDPCLRTVAGAFGAQSQHRGEIGVDGDPEPITRNRPSQGTRQMKTVEWQYRPAPWFDPVYAVGIAGIRHREYPNRVGT
jgi:hypothetical protein